MADKLSRKSFLKIAIASIAALFLSGEFARKVFTKTNSTNGRPKKNISGDHDLVVVKGPDPYQSTIKAVDGLGGMSRFVKKGDLVVIKPNIAWDRSPEQAANTNPLVVAALIDMSLGAGAKKVNIFDVPCNDCRRTYDNSQIKKVAEEHGANIYYADEWNTVEARFPYQSPMEGWPILKDALECDVFINVPVLKHHSLAGLTISMKNLMGVCGGNRGLIHQNIGRKLADLTDFVSPDLTVVDAYRALLRHGPVGGSLEDVALLETIIAGTDPVLCDSYAATLLDRDPMSLSFIAEGVNRKLGSADIASKDILKLTA